MYPLPEDFDPVQLKDRTLQMICFAQHSLYLHFDSGLLITVEGSFQHRGAPENFTGNQSFPLSRSALLYIRA
jgi:hypothetical protein